MMNRKITSIILILLSAIALGASAYFSNLQIPKMKDMSASFTTNSTNKKIKILIVPGHEPNAGGADEFKQIKERDLNLQLAVLLKNELSTNSEIEVVMARDENGWNKDLENFVLANKTRIMNWVSDMKNIMLAKAKSGEIKIINPGMKHNEATSNAVLFLYGTNKWIENNNIDLVLNIHFNNNPKYKGKPNYKGYCMYIPDNQYQNASTSKIFSNYLNDEISKIEVKSNMPQEKNTVIEDQQLIAIGNYDTLKIPAVVVEYAYIYEPMMVSSSTRNIFIEKAASSTAEAIRKYVANELLK